MVGDVRSCSLVVVLAVLCSEFWMVRARLQVGEDRGGGRGWAFPATRREFLRKTVLLSFGLRSFG